MYGQMTDYVWFSENRSGDAHDMNALQLQDKKQFWEIWLVAL